MTPTEIAQGQLDAYNAQDLDAHCAHFADDVIVGDLDGTVSTQGIDAYRERYAKLFAQYPSNHAALLARMVIGDTVIDHERVVRAPGAAPFEVAAIYTIAEGKIARVRFVR